MRCSGPRGSLRALGCAHATLAWKWGSIVICNLITVEGFIIASVVHACELHVLDTTSFPHKQTTFLHTTRSSLSTSYSSLLRFKRKYIPLDHLTIQSHNNHGGNQERHRPGIHHHRYHRAARSRACERRCWLWCCWRAVRPRQCRRCAYP